MESGEKKETVSRPAYLVSLAAIEVFLLVGAVASALGANMSASGLEGFFKTPLGISGAIDAALFVLFLTRFKPFEFFLFKAFACAGFFGYVAWCNSGENIAYLTIGMWIAAGLLTRNFGMLAAIVFAFLALGFQAYLIAV